MKKSTVILIAALFSIFQLNALNIEIEALKTGKRVSIVFEELTEDATVKLRSNVEGVLWTLSQEKESAKNQILNLENLENGRYEVVVSTPTREIIQPLMIAAQGVEVIRTERKEFFSPAVVTKEGSIVDLTFLNSTSSNVEVEIKDVDGNTVFTDLYENALQVHRRYQMSKLAAGSYTLLVKTPERFHYKQFRLDK